MPVPTLVTDLSTTLASNSPAGSDNVFPDLDNYLRAMSGFIASIRDNSGNGWVSPYLPLAGGTVSGGVIFSSTVALNGALSGTGLTTYLDSPPAIGGTTPAAVSSTNLSYTGTLTGGTGVVNLGSGQVYKDATGNLGIGTSSPGLKLDVSGPIRSSSSVFAGYASGFDQTYIGSNGATGNGCVMATVNYTNSAYQPITYDANLYIWRPNGTERMRFTANGDLGIGTSSPAYKAHIATAQTSALGVFRDLDVTSAGAAATYIELGARNGAAFTAGARIAGVLNNPATTGYLTFDTLSGGSIAERMRLDASGSLGIGGVPNFKLDVKDASAATVRAYTTSSGNASLIAQTAAGGTAYLQLTNAAGDHYIYGGIGGTQNISFGINGEKMRLDSSGNLGIGKTPAAKLDVLGTVGQIQSGAIGTNVIWDVGTTATRVRMAAAAATNDFLTGSAQSDGLIYSPADRLLVGTAGAKDTLFYTNNTERARITSGGEFFVGAVSTVGSATDRLQVDAPSSARAGVFRNPTTGVDTIAAWNSDTSGDNKFVQFYTEGSATVRGLIDYNRAGGLTRYNTTSDYRAKDIIGPVQDPGATIDALKVYEGVMKGATQSRPMLVAHEAQAHAPYAVSGVKDEVNEDGTPKFQQMDVSSLVPLLLAEIQSLRARVAALEAA